MFRLSFIQGMVKHSYQSVGLRLFKCGRRRSTVLHNYIHSENRKPRRKNNIVCQSEQRTHKRHCCFTCYIVSHAHCCFFCSLLFLLLIVVSCWLLFLLLILACILLVEICLPILRDCGYLDNGCFFYWFLFRCWLMYFLLVYVYLADCCLYC